MIKLQNYTPDVYYKESRDFQFIGRLFDLVLNSVKTETDLLYNLPLSANSDEKLLELLAMTLGFKPRHQYNARQLKAICSVFSEIMRNKGSIKALKIACEALFNALDISQELSYDFTPTANNDKTELNLYISQEFGDITILNDLLSYVLPAGMSCNIIRELQLESSANTNIKVTDTVKALKLNTAAVSGLTDLTVTPGTYAAANAASQDLDEDTAGLQALAGFSINSEVTQVKEESSNG